MQLINVLCVLWALLPSYVAAEPVLVCLGSDKCIKSVEAGPTTLHGSAATAAASSDCSSYFATTIVNCPSTTTINSTILVEKDLTVHITETITLGEPLITSVYRTVTVTKTISLPPVVTTTETVKTAKNIIVTMNLADEPTLSKRAIETLEVIPPREQDRPQLSEYTVVYTKRVCPETQTASYLPMYAWRPCQTVGRSYSSACTCMGIGKTTKTIQPPVFTTTVTVEEFAKPTRTVTSTTTITAAPWSTTEVPTTVVDIIVEEASGVPITALATAFKYTATQTTTTTIIPRSCRNFNIEVVGGAQDGKYLYNHGDDTEIIIQQDSIGVFAINDAGQLMTRDRLVAGRDDFPLSQLTIATVKAARRNGFEVLSCQQEPYLFCRAIGNDVGFVVCPEKGADKIFIGRRPNEGGCVEVLLRTVCVSES